MGNNIVSNRGGHQPEDSNRYNFSNLPLGLGLPGIKDSLAMAETKALMFLLNAIGYPLFGFTMIYIGGDVRGWILWVLAAMFAIFKVIHAYQDSVKRSQENKNRDLDLKEKEYNIFHHDKRHEK
jgi:hypothetical protein